MKISSHTSSVSIDKDTLQLSVWHINLGLHLKEALDSFLGLKDEVKEYVYDHDLSQIKPIMISLNNFNYKLKFIYTNLVDPEHPDGKYDLLFCLSITPVNTRDTLVYYRRIHFLQDLVIVDFNVPKIKVFIDDLDSDIVNC